MTGKMVTTPWPGLGRLDMPRLGRRRLFGLAGASALSGPMKTRLSPGSAGGMDLATPLRDGALALHVAGPRESDVAIWAQRLQAPLAAGLREGGALDLRYGGGVDGVVGANQFAARVAPDGRGALIFPGSVALDWLTGTQPVRLDPTQMLPLLAAIGPAILMVRGALPPPGPAGGRAPMRLAWGPHAQASLAALLGLDLLGIAASPASPRGPADAVFLSGPQAAVYAPSLLAAGYRPALSTCANGTGVPAHLHAPYFLAGLPAAQIAGDPLVSAWRAMADATRLCAALVLPRLCPSASIGRWRRASAQGAADAALEAEAQLRGVRLVAGADAAEALAPMKVDGATQIALRRWMAARAPLLPG